MSRSHFFTLIFALILSLNSIAQTAPPKQEAKRCVVAGRVIKGESPEPVRKAKVTLQSTMTAQDDNSDDETTGTPTVTTDQDGNFVLDNVKAGTYSLKVEKTGFSGVSTRHSRSAKAEQRLTLVAGQEVRDMLVRLVPSSSVSGRVLDRDGEPMANVGVSALRYRYAGKSKRRLRPADQVMTNDLGEYRMFGLEPGEYYISADPSGRPELEATSKPAPGKVQYRYGAMYYPGVANEVDAQPLRLRGGDEARVDFNLTASPAVKISGRLVGLGGSLNGFRCFVKAVTADGIATAGATVEEGSDLFDIPGVLPGTYTLVGVAQPKNDQSTRSMQMPVGTVKVTVNGADLSGIVIPLAPNTMRQEKLNGKIIIVGGPPENIENLGVMLRAFNWRDQNDEDSPFANMVSGRSDTVKKDGTFTLNAFGNSAVVASVYGTGPGVEDYYTKSIRYADRDVTETGFSLATNAPLEVEIGADGGRVEGIAIDEKDTPVSEATVVLVPDGKLRELPDLYISEHTDQNGHFLMRGVRPGSYTIYAWDDLVEGDGAYYYEDFLKRFANKVQSVRVEPKQRAAVKVKVQSAEFGAQAVR